MAGFGGRRPPTSAAPSSPEHEIHHVDLGVVRRQPGGVVAGTVPDAQGNPAGGASVKLDGESMHRQVTAGVRGRFRMESVPPGEYTLSATPATFFDAFKFHVEAGFQRVPVEGYP